MKVGYARVSSIGQNLQSQIDALEAYGCEKIFQEKVSGTSTKGRNEFKEMLNFVRENDEVVVTRLDRCSRSVLDMQLIMKDLEEKNVTFSATEQSINTKTPEGKCFLDMLGVFAEFETRLRHERQMEGIKKAKEKGVYKGRKQTLDVAKIKELASEGLMKTEIAKRLGIGRASVYRALND